MKYLPKSTDSQDVDARARALFLDGANTQEIAAILRDTEARVYNRLAKRPRRGFDNELTLRQRQVMEFMKDHFAAHSYPPLMKQLCGAINGKGSSCVYRVIDSLVAKGFLAWEGRRLRTLRLTGKEVVGKSETTQETSNGMV